MCGRLVNLLDMKLHRRQQWGGAVRRARSRLFVKGWRGLWATHARHSQGGLEDASARRDRLRLKCMYRAGGAALGPEASHTGAGKAGQQQSRPTQLRAAGAANGREC